MQRELASSVACSYVSSALGQAAAAGRGRCDPALESEISRRRTTPGRALAGRGTDPTMSRTLSMKSGILRQLKCVDAVRLQRECLPDARDGGLAEPRRLRHRARPPMSGVPRHRFEGIGNHALHHRVSNAARRPRPRLVQQPVEPRLLKTPTPVPQRQPVQMQLAGHGDIRAGARGRPRQCAREAPILERSPRRRIHCSSVARSLGLTMMRVLGRPRRSAIGASLYQEVREAPIFSRRISDSGH